MPRLFCAVKVFPLPPIHEIISRFRHELGGERIAWVDPGSLHITLKFFGDTPGHRIPAIGKALQRASAGIGPFSFDIRGCGTFGNPSRPRVIWLGTENTGELLRLYASVNRALAPLGYEPDRELFVPHLTIGRIKHIGDRRPLEELLGEYSDTHFGQAAIQAFYLFRSKLDPRGAVHQVERTVELGGSK